MTYKGKIKTNKKHRVCRLSGCEQILSMHNSETRCHVHQQLAMTQVSAVPLMK